MSKKLLLGAVVLAVGLGGAGYLFSKGGEEKASAPLVTPAGISEKGAAAQTLQEGGKPWITRCEEKKPTQCEAFQRIVVKENNQRLVEMAVGRPPESQEWQIAAILPLGVLVEPGVAIQVDDHDPMNLKIGMCGPNGCLAKGRLSEETLAQMKAGKTLKVGFLDPQKQKIKIQMTLDSFADALPKE